MSEITLVVEGAGCATCATRVRDALAPLARVRDVAVDEVADAATVSVDAPGLTEEAVTDVLAAASAGAGHAYRVRRGSWHAAASA